MLTCLLTVGWSVTNVILQYIAMQENAGLHRPGFASKSPKTSQCFKKEDADVQLRVSKRMIAAKKMF